MAAAGAFVGLLISAIPLAIAYALTASLSLPTPADIGIWVVAGVVAFFYFTAGVTAGILGKG